MKLIKGTQEYGSRPSLLECLPSICETLVQSLSVHKLGRVLQKTAQLSGWRQEALEFKAIYVFTTSLRVRMVLAMKALSNGQGVERRENMDQKKIYVARLHHTNCSVLRTKVTTPTSRQGEEHSIHTVKSH